MNIALVTGFLGAGKTSWINHHLEHNTGEKLGVVVNDFGTENIDAQLLQSHGISMEEVSNGSIFCACVKDKFIDAMILMAQKPLDWILVEASGLADPSNIETIVDIIRKETQTPLTYTGAICIVDALLFPDQADLLPVLSRQIEHSDVILINKIDLISDDALLQLEEQLLGLNMSAKLIHATYGRCEGMNPLEYARPSRKAPEPSTNTVDSRPIQLNLNPLAPLPIEDLARDLEFLLEDAFRIKGFVETTEGPRHVDCVGSEVQIKPWDQPVENGQIIALSSAGINILQRASTLKKHYNVSIQR